YRRVIRRSLSTIGLRRLVRSVFFTYYHLPLSSEGIGLHHTMSSIDMASSSSSIQKETGRGNDRIATSPPTPSGSNTPLDRSDESILDSSRRPVSPDKDNVHPPDAYVPFYGVPAGRDEDPSVLVAASRVPHPPKPFLTLEAFSRKSSQQLSLPPLYHNASVKRKAKLGKAMHDPKTWAGSDLDDGTQSIKSRTFSISGSQISGLTSFSPGWLPKPKLPSGLQQQSHRNSWDYESNSSMPRYRQRADGTPPSGGRYSLTRESSRRGPLLLGTGELDPERQRPPLIDIILPLENDGDEFPLGTPLIPLVGGTKALFNRAAQSGSARPPSNHEVILIPPNALAPPNSTEPSCSRGEDRPTDQRNDERIAQFLRERQNWLGNSDQDSPSSSRLNTSCRQNKIWGYGIAYTVSEKGTSEIPLSAYVPVEYIVSSWQFPGSGTETHSRVPTDKSSSVLKLAKTHSGLPADSTRLRNSKDSVMSFMGTGLASEFLSVPVPQSRLGPHQQSTQEPSRSEESEPSMVDASQIWNIQRRVIQRQKLYNEGTSFNSTKRRASSVMDFILPLSPTSFWDSILHPIKASGCC
ncbi:uncharacterized protein BJ171DRAFT_638148, partial [Polychytrium aggregatum]|uniref:uncharacterized protein n=1 Tax=Polychytrium aggregatum TaxID=110093 RepID=UPI0022FDE967